MRVAVIGAGFAGLAAATELAAGGADVRVFEARDRVGGRVWSATVPTPSGDAVVERGGEFILQGYDELRRYAQDLGIRLVDTGMSYYRREPRGVVGVDARMMAEAGDDIAERIAAHDDDSIDAVLEALSLAPDLAEAVRCRIEISCALEVEELSTDVMANVASLAPRPSHRLAGGNQGLALGLAERLGERVHLSTPVRSIAVDDDGVEVRTDTESARFDRVVLAVPLPLLIDLPVSPALPPWKRAALERCSVGHAAKLHVPLESPVAPLAVMSVPDRYWSWVALDASGAAPAVLNCFVGSPSARDRLDVRSGSHTWISRLRAIQPELSLLADEAILTVWSDDPWARCAYTTHGRRAQPDDAARLREPYGRLHFAGEYSAGELAGLMEGALRSGQRAAAEILRESRPAR